MRVYELIEKLSKHDKTLIITRKDKGMEVKEINKVILRITATPDYPEGRYLDIDLEI